MKFGIIGSGMIMQELLPDLTAMDGIEVVAIQGSRRIGNHHTYNIFWLHKKWNGAAQPFYSFFALIDENTKVCAHRKDET